MKRQTLYCSLLFSVAMLIVPGEISAQGIVSFSAPVEISTDGNHALASMLEHIQHLYSTAIDFEEVPLKNPSDMVVTPVIMKSGRHLVVARGGKLTVQLDRNDSNAYQAVESVLAAYANSGLPGSYQAINEGDRVDVVPTQTRAANGLMQSVMPILSSNISLDYKERGTYMLADNIASAMSKASGRTVFMSIIGASESISPGEMTGFSGETARSALSKLAGFAYQALFDPGEKAYYLNIQPTITHAPIESSTVAKPSIPRGRPQKSPFFVKQ